MYRRQPAVAEALLACLTDMTIAYLRAQVGAGVQAVQLFDSWVGVLGPYDYEVVVAPHMRAIFDAVRALGVPSIHFATGPRASCRC
jgi:uroporphyrinogen decarboxylase